jgi:benzil reductase ((S)-benzoin forming)
MTIRNAIVTGATSGIGAAIAAELVARGVAVVGSGRRSVDPAALPTGLTIVRRDLTQPDAVDSLFSEAVEILGSVDTVIHSVGHEYPIALLADADLRSIPGAVSALVASPAMVLAAAIRTVSREGPSRILLVSSGAALRPLPARSLYSAAKAAVNQLVRSAAVEVADSPVAVAAIMPGRVDTPMQRRLVLAAQDAPDSLHLQDFRSMDGVSPPAVVAAAVWQALQQPTDELNGAILRYRDGSFKPVA